ncbi:Dicer-like protein [Seminavis robusta]|uniref:Dicer-like protein n=1 Tax=Seminavis robusta TaxID=568900 RepID=A0A9N8DT72_9STRA|nr:Dicer-like protein [Seminavis robusta]|eukprot:Sro263_g102360.1 Dicer-like protein (673) ;mRNA; f:69767-71785
MTALVLYPYQKESLAHAKERNTIVNLPTGRGKTLIAVKLIEHCLQAYPARKVAFLVPTRALVEQHYKYCKDHVRLPHGSPPSIQKLAGQAQAYWDESDWNEAFRSNHIFVGTEKLFQDAFVATKFLDIGSFSLFVFDECHKAVGSAPMAVVMRDGVAPHQAQGLHGPKILGLTASFVSGSLKNMEKKRRDLEKVLLSTLICPDVRTRIGDDSFRFVNWSKSPHIDRQEGAIKAHVEAAVQHVGQIKEQKKIIARCAYVFQELGADALFFYVERVIVAQVLARAKILMELPDAASVDCGERMLEGVPALRSEVAVLRTKLLADPLVQQADRRSIKVQKLIDLLQDQFLQNQNGHRGMVFVQQVALVSSLAKVLNDTLSVLHVKCGAVAGCGHQSEFERQAQLDHFRSGEIQIIVATPALEEGIDVPECAFVVRYTAVQTTKAHIQGAGRARHENAQIFYFENDPQDERQKEAAMNTVAKDRTLALTADDLQKAIHEIDSPRDKRHPYPLNCRMNPSADSTGEVNVYNCKEIFNRYCSVMLGTPVQPKKILYKYTVKEDGRKFLSKVRFPSPHGWQHLTYDNHYILFWGRANLDNFFSADRTKRKTVSEKEEMTFVYIVVVTLREKGYLDCHNKPNKACQLEARRNCDVDSEWSDAIPIKDRVFQSYGAPLEEI